MYDDISFFLFKLLHVIYLVFGIRLERLETYEWYIDTLLILQQADFKIKRKRGLLQIWATLFL